VLCKPGGLFPHDPTCPTPWQVHPAPGPDEVNWTALWFTHKQRVASSLGFAGY
jgi:hypothetical protein